MIIQRVLFVLLLAFADLAGAQVSEQVNTTSTQILTNKTLTAPTITGPTISGTVAGGASYTAPTLTSPTISGAIGGSATWPAPGTIGGTTPGLISGTTITASTSFLNGTCKLLTGAGSPEGAQTAPVCSRYLRTDGSTGTTLYIKESGAGNTGWVAVSPSSVTWSAPGTIGSGTPNTGAFTTLSATGQITSTLTTGTAPLAVTSTTKVTNLNADLLDGGDWAAPGAIGSTTPAAITGTTVQANTSFNAGTAAKILWGTGSPEGAVTANVGSLYFRTDGSSGTTLYTKEAGTGNAGWAAMAPSTINWAVPGAIGSTTPNTGVFTTLTATRFNTKSWSPTYGATVTIDVSQGTVATISASNSTAFTISNPTNGVADDDLWIRVKNSSGGALGTITWDTQYIMASFTKPASGKYRVVHFKRLGTVWVELNCSPEITNEP